jgi:NarL family two-component system response regulator LiaR
MTDKIRILIADDHPVIRQGLHGMLDAKPGLQIVGEAADGAQAVEKALALEPDILLLDLAMPHKDGIQVIEEVKGQNPAIRILVLTSFAEDERVLAAIKAGAEGYLLKESRPDTLVQAIQDVHEGRSWLHPSIAHKMIQEMNQPSELPLTEDPLTARELEVLRLVARGMSNSEMAGTLFVSESTVRVHISNILGKLHLANRVQAAVYAVREGIVELED